MPDNVRVTLVDPYKALYSPPPLPEFDFVSRKCLAQGDSWFSIGALPSGLTSNLLAQMVLGRPTAVINCAAPGKLLQHMTEAMADRNFVRLLTGSLASRWDAILVSGGGNDMIEAATSGPEQPADLRLLALPAERGDPASGDGYISNAGWQTFATHLATVFDQLVALRESGPNKGVPLVCHTYCHGIMPRPSPVGFGHGPWLEPAMRAFDVPPPDWLAVSQALIDRLASLLDDVRAKHPNVIVVDSRQASMVPGDAASDGESNDFCNEIHPTRAGYAKLAEQWRTPVDDVLQ